MTVSAFLRGLRAIVGVGLVVSFPGLGQAKADDAPVRFERSEATIMTRQGPVRFEVELALTSRQHEQGLQHRQSLRAYEGMLFVYDDVRPIYMWMKNTLVSLDMIFFGEDGRILNIAERTTPLSLETIPSGRPAKGVLEVVGGTARRFEIRLGDRVVHPLLGGG